jgi:DinB superfamily
MTTETDELTVREVLARMDDGWRDFQEHVQALPGEALQARLGDGTWTRKQMLAHIGTWHDMTVERLSGLVSSGEAPGIDEDEDVVNARAARAAEGRTSGEVLQGMQDSYGRLRREVARLTDAQLALHDGFAASIIAGNSYGHYREHLADLGAPVERDEAARQ